MSQVLDAYALLAYLEKEPGWEKVSELFSRASGRDKNLSITAVNWGEVYYIIMREYDYHKAEEVEQFIRTLPIEVVAVDIDIARDAAGFKSAHKLSYADCFAAALAKKKKAELITGDKEFKVVEGQIKINWI
ncbi:MAG: type II toxin-antitoxin system VapC family toxin [Planctomycetes bacterium]|nr:type II toxin-antitoxin system VapC family toxin [Planctomycetota bacterium]